MVRIPETDETLKDPLCQEKSALGKVRISYYLATTQVKVSCMILARHTSQIYARLPAQLLKTGGFITTSSFKIEKTLFACRISLSSKALFSLTLDFTLDPQLVKNLADSIIFPACLLFQSGHFNSIWIRNDMG